MGTVYAFAQAHPEADVRLLTHDTTPLYTAQGLGLQAEITPEEWLLPPEENAQGKTIEALETELERLRRAEPSFTVEFLDGHDTPVKRFEAQVPRYTPLDGEQEADAMARLRQRFPLATQFEPPSASKRSTGDALRALQRVTATYRPPTEKEIAEYRDDAYPKWLSRCEHSPSDMHTVFGKQQDTLLRFSFRVGNGGTRPAEDALVTVRARGPFQVMPAPPRSKPSNPATLPPPPRPPRGGWRDPFAEFRAMVSGKVMPTFESSKWLLSPLSHATRDPNTFYFDPERPEKPQSAFRLTCDQWRHAAEPIRRPLRAVGGTGVIVTTPGGIPRSSTMTARWPYSIVRVASPGTVGVACANPASPICPSGFDCTIRPLPCCAHAGPRGPSALGVRHAKMDLGSGPDVCRKGIRPHVARGGITVPHCDDTDMRPYPMLRAEHCRHGSPQARQSPDPIIHVVRRRRGAGRVRGTESPGRPRGAVPFDGYEAMKILGCFLIALAYAATVRAHDSGDGVPEHYNHTPGDSIDGCFPTNQPLQSGDGSEGSPVVYHTSQCKIGCQGIHDSAGHVVTSYPRTYGCTDFNLPDAIKGSPCLGGHEYIQAGFPVQLHGLRPNSYDEIVNTLKGCANEPDGRCRRVQLGYLGFGPGDKVNAPAGYFRGEKAIIRGMDFLVNGTPVQGSGARRSFAVPDSRAIRIISVSAAEGTEVAAGDELYKYCSQTLANLFNGIDQGQDPPIPAVISSTCGGAIVTAPISGIVTLAPTVNRIYVDSDTSLDDRCIVVAQGTGGTTNRCKKLSDLGALEDFRVDNYPTAGSGLGDQFSTLCSSDGCIYTDEKISQIEYNEYTFPSDGYKASIAFDRFFSGTTTGVQLHDSARMASNLTLRAQCLHSDCRVDPTKTTPAMDDAPTASNPKAHRSFFITGWDSVNKTHILGPLEGLADWLNKVDVSTITADISFDTGNTNSPLNNACPYAPDPDATPPPLHPQDHPLYCAPEDGHDWTVTYDLTIDTIEKPAGTALADNNCCTGYKSYSCEFQDEPRPSAEEWAAFDSTNAVNAVKTWFEANNQQMQLTYVNHIADSLGTLNTCPAGTNDSRDRSTSPCWWHYDMPQGEWTDGFTIAGWRALRQYNSASDCKSAVDSIDGWVMANYDSGSSEYGGGTGQDCHEYIYSGNPVRFTEIIFHPGSDRPSIPPKVAKAASSRFPSKACPAHGTSSGQNDYTTDADCDGVASDSDDTTPGSPRLYAPPWEGRTTMASGFAGTDACRYAPGTGADGCPADMTYREVGQAPVEPVEPEPEPEPDNIGDCVYEPSSLEGAIIVDLEVLEGDWDMCAWAGNWRDVQARGYDDPQADCESVPDYALWAKSAGGMNGERESFTLENGLDDVSVCVVPYNDSARHCRGRCYAGPTYTSHAAVAVDDDGPGLTWEDKRPGPSGWFFELQNLPGWAVKVVAVANLPDDLRLKLFLAEEVYQPPDPMVLGTVEVTGANLRETRAGLWQIDVSADMLRRLGVDTSE